MQHREQWLITQEDVLYNVYVPRVAELMSKMC